MGEYSHGSRFNVSIGISTNTRIQLPDCSKDISTRGSNYGSHMYSEHKNGFGVLSVYSTVHLHPNMHTNFCLCLLLCMHHSKTLLNSIYILYYLYTVATSLITCGLNCRQINGLFIISPSNYEL